MGKKEYQEATNYFFDKVLSKIAIVLVGIVSVVMPYVQLRQGYEVTYVNVVIIALSASAMMLVYFYAMKWIFVNIPPKFFKEK